MVLYNHLVGMTVGIQNHVAVRVVELSAALALHHLNKSARTQVVAYDWVSHNNHTSQATDE